MALLLLALISGEATAQQLRDDFWVTDGAVYAVARSGNTIYLGGQFTHVGPNTGGGVPVAIGTGQPISGFPRVRGTVECVVSDGVGGWYVGGTFTQVGNQPRRNLVHILSDLSISPWNPDPDSTVMSLMVSGGTVYAGGLFSNIGGQLRKRLAALDAVSGLATAWNAHAAGPVNALAISGGTVYVGGSFVSMGGQPRNFVAAVDASTGLATPWDPAADAAVRCLTVSGGRVYVGGEFRSIGGQSLAYVAALDMVTGEAVTWNAQADGPVYALAVRGGTVYAGGSFKSIGGRVRHYIAALDAGSGLAMAWDPDASFDVNSLVVNGGIVYVGGSFARIGVLARIHIAAIDATTGAVTAWDPTANNVVNALAVSGGAAYVGGKFSGIGGQVRQNLAALDASTGVPRTWNPDADSTVNALAVNGGTVYAGGDFSSISGQLRGHLAALDASTGAVGSWNPGANGSVKALAVNGGTVYVGGAFTRIGGQVRNRIAAVDANAGSVGVVWNPGADAIVYALVVSGRKLYAGGDFTSIGGQTRRYIAVLDVSTGVVAAWNPDASSTVFALEVSSGRVYAGGYFSAISAQARKEIAALDTITGAATPWNARIDQTDQGEVIALAVSGGTVYAGGFFHRIVGQAAEGVVALDTTTGAATAWNPNANASVRVLMVNGGMIYAGGVINDIGGDPVTGLAVFDCGAAPNVVASPRDVVTCRNGPASLQIQATGTALSYQWRREGTTLSGATSPVLTLNFTALSDSGLYDCVVTDACGQSVVTGSARLKVLARPVVTASSPSSPDTTLCAGNPLALAVSAVGGDTLNAYQWRRAGVALANGPTLRIAAVAASDSGQYVCTVSTCRESVTVTARVHVVPARIDTVPTSAGAGDLIQVTGVGFDQTRAVRVGGVAAASWQVINSTTLRVQLPRPAYSGAVEVDCDCGTKRSAGLVAVQDSVTMQTSATPAYANLAAVGSPLMGGLGQSGLALGVLGLTGKADVDWRVSSYDPAVGHFVGADTLRVGRGYWVQTKDPWRTQVTGVVPRGDVAVVVPLASRGWHQLGNPYRDVLHVGSCRVRTGGIATPFPGGVMDAAVWVWKGSQLTYALVDTVAPEETFWVEVTAALVPADLALEIPRPGSVAAPVVQMVGDGTGPRVVVTARQGLWSAQATLGSDGDSAVAARRTSPAPPEPPVRRLTLTAERPGSAERYQTLIEPDGDAGAWELQLGGLDAPGEIELEATVERWPSGRRLLLRDEASPLELELVPGQRIRLAAQPERRLRLVASAQGPQSGESVEGVRPYPNPFDGSVGFWFTLARPQTVRVDIYDLAGRRLRQLETRADVAGERVLVWDGRDAGGHEVGSGVYFARCAIGTRQRTLRVMRMR